MYYLLGIGVTYNLQKRILSCKTTYEVINLNNTRVIIHYNI